MPSFAGARAKLKTATADLFRLTSNSIPVEMAEVSVPAPPPAPAPDSASGRKAEASIMFSLEELMKANQVVTKQDDAPDQLWSMQAATPLFGTAHDQALLTTPLKLEQPAQDSMTIASRPAGPRGRLPLLVAMGAVTLAALGAGGYWQFGGASVSASTAAELTTPSSEQMASSGKSPVEGLPGSATPEPAIAQPVAAAPEPPIAAVPGDAPVAKEEAPAEAAPGKAATAAASRPTSQAKSAKKAPARPVVASSGPKVFDTGAARDALSTASTKAAGCKQAGSAGGKGKVQLTFATTGRVSSASIIEGPLAGTASGNCALRHFRAARVPAFSGSPQTVAKSFKIP